MCLAQNDDVIQTLAPDRSDQPLGKAILPRRSWCDRLVPNAHGAQSACDDGAIDAIPVPDHVARCLIPGKCFRYLTCHPFSRRIRCDVPCPKHSTRLPKRIVTGALFSLIEACYGATFAIVGIV